MNRRRTMLTLTAAGVLVATLAACGGGGSSSSTDVSTTTAAGDIAPGVLYPLTGLAVTDPIAAGRPALAVKIDNHPIARPQTGLNKADIVFEENVEGITRFIAVF
ncbi:MAG: DUF3048 domain-containing protein, partial [Actinobacteria bacterium]|nr:DUF3048 domain-containing protein [Actinomycetota bacterium]